MMGSMLDFTDSILTDCCLFDEYLLKKACVIFNIFQVYVAEFSDLWYQRFGNINKKPIPMGTQPLSRL